MRRYSAKVTALSTFRQTAVTADTCHVVCRVHVRRHYKVAPPCVSVFTLSLGWLCSVHKVCGVFVVGTRFRWLFARVLGRIYSANCLTLGLQQFHSSDQSTFWASISCNATIADECDAESVQTQSAPRHPSMSVSFDRVET